MTSAVRAEVAGILIGAQPAPAGVTQQQAGGPFGEGNFADQARLGPLGLARVPGGHRAGERAGGAAQHPQPPGQIDEHGLGEAGADVPCVPQLAVVKYAEQQRADGVSAAALAGFPAADDDLGVPDVLDLDPAPALAGMVARLMNAS